MLPTAAVDKRIIVVFLIIISFFLRNKRVQHGIVSNFSTTTHKISKKNQPCREKPEADLIFLRLRPAISLSSLCDAP